MAEDAGRFDAGWIAQRAKELRRLYAYGGGPDRPSGGHYDGPEPSGRDRALTKTLRVLEHYLAISGIAAYHGVPWVIDSDAIAGEEVDPGRSALAAVAELMLEYDPESLLVLVHALGPAANERARQLATPLSDEARVLVLDPEDKTLLLADEETSQALCAARDHFWGSVVLQQWDEIEQALDRDVADEIRGDDEP